MMPILKWSNPYLLKNGKCKLKEEFKTNPIVFIVCKGKHNIWQYLNI